MVTQHPDIPVATEPADTGPVPEFDSTEVSLLIVDPRPGTSALLASELRPLRHVVSAVSTVDAASAWLGAHDADVIALFSVSRAEALDGARRLRATTELPLIVAGPDATAESRVGAFDRGAQDYIALPVYPEELDRRVRALVRREQFRDRGEALQGPEGLVMYPRAYEAHLGAERLALTPKEFAVLQVLLERRGEVVVPDQLSMSIWGYETFGSKNFVEAHVSRLRRKLRRAGATAVVKTVRGVGYVIR